MVDIRDIVNVVEFRFRDFKLYLAYTYNSGSKFSYCIYASGGIRIGFVIFYRSGVSYVCGKLTEFINYGNLDIDILVGFFLCEAYYND